MSEEANCQPEPTPEELLVMKKEKFEKNPDGFIDMDFLVAGAVFDQKSQKVLIFVNPNTPREDFSIAYTELAFFMQNELARRVQTKNKNKFSIAMPGPNGGKKSGGMFGKKRF